MKFLRVGEVDKEIPAILDADNKLRNISSYIDDFNSRSLNFDTIEKIKNIDLKALPEISSDIRIGSCVSRSR
jgi:2,4-diketo-3-deoxy-L-fuconate hydrolase